MSLYRRRMIAGWVAAATIALALIVVSVSWYIQVRRGSQAERALAEQYQTLLEIKSDAERLAGDGKLAEAHAKYQEFAKIVGGRHIQDSALWEFTERAKGDQDRVYSLLLSERENVLASRKLEIARAAAAFRPGANAELPSSPYPKTAATMPSSDADEPATQAAEARPTTTQASAPAPAESVAAAASVLPPPTPATAPVARVVPATLPADAFGDEKIGQSMQKAANYLIDHFKADQIALESKPNDTYGEGVNALCVYALLRAGQTLPDERLRMTGPFMKGLIERMKDHLMLVDLTNPNAPVTYARSLRTTALAIYNRPEDRKILEQDVQWLLRAATDGAYTYNDRIGRWDQPDLQRFMGEDPPGGTLFYYDPKPKATWLHNGEKTVPVLPTYRPPQQSIRPGASLRGTLIPEPPNLPWDNSNTQYGVMGVAAGADVGVEVPNAYWAAAERHWMNTQLPTGEWEYDGTKPSGYFAMTVGGVSSLLITHDWLDAPILGSEVGKIPYSGSLAAGLAWMDKGDNGVAALHEPVHYLGYNLFGLSRVGALTGYKYFGRHEWYREWSQKAIDLQFANGAWGRKDAGTDTIIDTAYVLLFLAQGRSPVMFNKLKFEGFWNNRARDVFNLARFTGRELERPLNWQVVPIDRAWTDWMDSPVLYIASQTAPKLKDEDYAKLRQFAEAGGLIFTHADGGSPAFNSFVAALAKKLFPDYPLAPLPPDHELYSLQYKLKKPPQLRGVSNGSRLLLVHSPTDLASAWQVRDGSRRENFELAVNVFLYAAGKPNLRNRLASPLLPEPAGKPVRTVGLARLKYAGTWNPEPYAWERMGRLLRLKTGWNLDVMPVDAAELTAQTAPVAHLTGTAELALTDAQLQALKRYVEGGGVVLIDACGGSPAFLQSARAMLARAFPDLKLEAVLPGHPLLVASSQGMADLSRPLVRAFVDEKLGKAAPKLEMLSAGKGKVILSGLDITTGLLGTDTWGVLGYQPRYAEGLVQNLLIWAAGSER